MDYDDNDFQSQNLHLAGEGSTKFPPVFRPYALPKFDFDESLQGHLRFDSLVETEVLLGIESNEDNQWIDAYSRGSSGIEFSSTAAESCSISRHNNVWSEATSSESVEMLLKSVGQEEYIPRQTVIEESNACDELACLTKQMEPNLRPDDKNAFKGEVTELQQLDSIHGNLSGLKEDVGRVQSQTGVCQAHNGELSIGRSSSNPESNYLCRNIDLPVSEGSLFTDGNSNNANERVQTVSDGSLDDKTLDDSSAAGVQNKIAAASLQMMPSTSNVLNVENERKPVVGGGDEQQGFFATETNKQEMESSISSKDTDVYAQTLKGNAAVSDAHCLDKPLCSVSVKEGLEDGSVVEGLESTISNIKDSFGMVSSGASVLQNAEICSEDTNLRNPSGDSASEDAILHKDSVIEEQSALITCDLPKVASKGDTSSEGQVVEISNSSFGICSNLQQDVDAGKKSYDESIVIKDKELLNSGHQMDAEVLVSKSDAPMFTVVDNNTSNIGKENSDSKVGSFPSVSVASSTKSCIFGESTQMNENNEVDREGDHEKLHHNVSVNEQESTKVPSDSGQVHGDVDQFHLDKGAGSSTLTAGSMETEPSTSTLLVDVPAVKESASQAMPDNHLVSCKTIDVPPPSSDNVSNHEVTDHNNAQRITPRVGSAPIDEKEHSVANVQEEAGIFTPVGISEVENSPSPVTETEKRQPCDFSGQQLSVDVNKSLQIVGSDTEKTSESQGVLGDKVIKECAKEICESPVVSELTAKRGDEVTVSFDEHDKETFLENYEKQASKISGDTLHANKGSVISDPVPESQVELHEIGACPADITCSPSITIGGSSQTDKDGNEVKASADHSATIRGSSQTDKDGNEVKASADHSATIRGSSQTDKDGNQVKASADQNPPVSDFISKDATNMLSTAYDSKKNDASKNDESLPSEANPLASLSKKNVAGLTAKDVGKRKSVPATSGSKASTVVEVSPSNSGLGPTKTKSAGIISHGSPQISDREIAGSISKGTPERKRRASNKTAGKESSRKGSRVKETTQARQPEKGDKISNVSLSPSPGFQLMQSYEMQLYGQIDCSSTKPFALVNTSTSSLPDLNTSASPPVLFQQPFADLQQVQLRAQIFVYGALIQGTAPDEAYMISAFGGPDGGRSLWENAWRACLERQHTQKSHPINPETPLQSRSGPRSSDFSVKQSGLQGKGISSPLGRASSKATAPIVNPLVPLSSPLWSVPTPCDSLTRGSVVDYPQALTSVHPYQTPPLRNFIGHNTSWISQSPLRGPWIASPTPAPDNGSHPSASVVSDTIKLNSVKGSSLPLSSGMKNVTPDLPASSGGPQSIFIGTVPLIDTNNVAVPPAQHSSDPKPKKRKKVMAPEDLSQKALQSQSQPESTPAVRSYVSTSVAITTPVGNVARTMLEKSVMSVSPLSAADHLKSDRNVDKRILSDESLNKVKEARVHAEEAATHSAAAVSHSLEIWNQLDKQKNSGLVSDIEAKLASAAVAVAAAAAVAKAAAAAANVASNAALQAKLMADEALVSSGYENSCQSSGISFSEDISNLGKATPASILKGANANSSCSIIVAAKEAVKRKVEAASAATKQAENMDAIVKAAELAAEAVSQAGKIVTMGDSLLLNDLIEAGPESCLKAARESSRQVGLSKDMTRGLINIDNDGDSPGISHTLARVISSDDMGKQIAASEKSPLHMKYNEKADDRMRSIDGISNSVNISERNSRGPKGRKVSDLVNPVDVVPESETEVQASSFVIGNGSEKLENNIKEGSLVEVFRDGEGTQPAWFTANVVSLKDGKAYVCYTVLVADEGAGPLKEWVTLEGEGDKHPKIRFARPLTGMRSEGARKRRRAAMGDYAWSVGDKVDAWIQESWREGVVTEKNKKDETILTVHFPACGETSVVQAWHLRPSLIWKDGKWIECTRVGANNCTIHESDTPHEKRPKLSNPSMEAKGNDKISKSINDAELVNPDELRLLDLTENEKVFNIGKSGKNENQPGLQRTARTGLQKEGSKVVFGVPKPGKKRKFMEVSKHYVTERSNKVSDGNDSVKLANFLMPQGSGSRGWKSSSKNDTKEKRGADSKPKTLKSGKPQSVVGRAFPPKDNPLANSFSHPINLTDQTDRIKDSAAHYKNALEVENQVDIASYSTADGATEGPILYSSLATSTDAPSSKKTSTSRASKGKLAPAGGKLGKIEEEKALNSNLMKSTSGITEPRRSNRRIQPTSRLLEGLQSSLIISKFPSVSHEKGHKNQNRNASRGNNQG